MFKSYEDYKNQRAELMNAAQTLLNDGKMEDFAAKTKEVEELDGKWDEYAKAQADLNALAGTQKPQVNVLDLANGNGLVGATGALDGDLAYRKAFMNYVVNGQSIPTNLRNADANTKTTDVGELIPETVMNRIVEKMESTGMILPLLTRTSYKGGVRIPLATAKPTATWVAEGAGSDRQKKTVNGSITFGYYKLRCAVSVSLETDLMALSAFETTLINNVSEAMVKAVEQSVISGTGNGQSKGILTETVPDGQNVDIAAGADVSYQTLIDAEARLPMAYESAAVWFMTKQTFMKFAGMVDSNGQPIARTNYGIAGKPERILLGRTVILNDYMTSLGATITKDTVVAFLFNPKDYILNTNLNMTIKHYEDNDTDDQVTKAIMLVDGKVVDVNSLVTITKKSA